MQPRRRGVGLACSKGDYHQCKYSSLGQRHATDEHLENALSFAVEDINLDRCERDNSTEAFADQEEDRKPAVDFVNCI